MNKFIESHISRTMFLYCAIRAIIFFLFFNYLVLYVIYQEETQAIKLKPFTISHPDLSFPQLYAKNAKELKTCI